MAKNDPSWDDVWKILLVVIVILVVWWWRSDQGRVNYIKELEEQISKQEEQIEELKMQNESLSEEATYYYEKYHNN